jgi:hypothetical protein
MASKTDTASEPTTFGDGKSVPVKQSLMGRLVSVYGMRFLVMVSICAHFNKGFGQAHQRQTFKLLMTQGYKVKGEKYDTMEAISLMPAALAPTFTILSEFYPIGGYHKLYYLFGALVIGTLGLIMSTVLEMDEANTELCTFGIFLGQFAWMACDVFSQGLYSATMAKHPETGPDLVMFVWIGQQIAGVAAALLSGIITEYVADGLRISNMLLIFPTAMAIYPAFMNWLGEKKVDSSNGGSSVIREQLLKEKVIMILSFVFGFFALVFSFAGLGVPESGIPFGLERTDVMIFVTIVILFSEGFLAYRYLNTLIGKLVIFNLICRFTDMTITGAASHFYFDSPEIYPDGPHFSKIFVTSWCGAAAYGASALALPIYNAISKKMKFRNLYTRLILLTFFFKMSNAPLYARWNVVWGINDHLWMVVMTITTRVAGMLYEMPANLLMSRACPKSLGTTAMAMIGSATRFAFNSNKFVSGAVCKMMGVDPQGKKASSMEAETQAFSKLWICATIVCIAKVIPIFFLWLLPDAKTTDALFTPDSDYAKSALRIRISDSKQKMADAHMEEKVIVPNVEDETKPDEK